MYKNNRRHLVHRDVMIEYDVCIETIRVHQSYREIIKLLAYIVKKPEHPRNAVLTDYYVCYHLTARYCISRHDLELNVTGICRGGCREFEIVSWCISFGGNYMLIIGGKVSIWILLKYLIRTIEDYRRINGAIIEIQARVNYCYVTLRMIIGNNSQGISVYVYETIERLLRKRAECSAVLGEKFG